MLYLVPVVILSFLHITCTNTLFHICQTSRDGSFLFILLLRLLHSLKSVVFTFHLSSNMLIITLELTTVFLMLFPSWQYHYLEYPTKSFSPFPIIFYTAHKFIYLTEFTSLKSLSLLFILPEFHLGFLSPAFLIVFNSLSSLTC